MRPPRTTTLFAALAVAILLLAALTFAPGVEVPEDFAPPMETAGLVNALGVLSLVAIVVLTLLLLRRMPR
ncbi:hypothetical protein [Halorubrum vacuolatum]|uniref:Uncharacterized protein n=1 Tax=Halorubrum vacuolatum TaxID=63740 RepID=A0A238WTR6_HALVU|nr:hypothetical protein [Halorubrum vacuolatum]SNR49956.1 hypothetical protein SAMN06264855_11037 [Halorubrum vacuolatum]